MTCPSLFGFSLVFGAIAAKLAHLSDSAIIYRALYHVLILGVGFEFVEETIFGPSYFFLFVAFSFHFLRLFIMILANSVVVCNFESWVEQWYVKVSPLAKAEEILVILIFLVASLTFLAVNAEADGDIRDDALWILLFDFQLFLFFLLIEILIFLFGVFLLLRSLDRVYFSVGHGFVLLDFLEDIDNGSVPPVIVLFDPDLFADSLSEAYCGFFSFCYLLFFSFFRSFFFFFLTAFFTAVIIVVSLLELIVFLPVVLFSRLSLEFGEVERPTVNQRVAPRGQLVEHKSQLVSHSPCQAGQLLFSNA